MTKRPIVLRLFMFKSHLFHGLREDPANECDAACNAACRHVFVLFCTRLAFAPCEELSGPPYLDSGAEHGSAVSFLFIFMFIFMLDFDAFLCLKVDSRMHECFGVM